MKFLKQHAEIIFDSILAVGLISVLDWNWTNIKSFITGGVITWLIMLKLMK